ncbi:MAG TPA: ABC transporter ATP-binding protein, partial [Thauera sp.]|nr:ABC transporter ATP-binding protein [Thauera sp.]
MPDSAREVLLSVRGVRKSYGARPALKGVDLQVCAGEFVALLGPNGAGKTNCFYMIVGLVRADGGQINLDGTDL